MNKIDPSGLSWEHAGLWVLESIMRNVNTNYVFNRGFFGMSIVGRISSAVHYNENSKYTFSSYITNQYRGDAAKISMGYALISNNACGWVAAFNSFHTLGMNVQPADIVSWIEWNNGLIMDGVFGYNPNAFDRLFANWGWNPAQPFLPI